MGNAPSTHARSSNASPASSTHGQHQSTPSGSGPAPPPAPSEKRKEPKLRENIHSQKGAAPESSQVQARGTTTAAHRTTPSGSSPQPSSQPPSYVQAQAQSRSQSQSHSNSPSQSEYRPPKVYTPYPTESPSQPQHQYATSANDDLYSSSPRVRPARPVRAESHQTQTGNSSTPPQNRDQRSQPVAVPQPVNNSATVDVSNDIKSPPYAHSEHGGGLTDTMSYHLSRPPRLPLPIDEEVHTPGSPILGPADAQAPLPDLDPLDGTTRALSDEEEEEDEDELPIDKTKPVVPTTFTWRGDPSVSKVYVTGTIFQWNSKRPLLPVKGQPGLFQKEIPVLPGTHHIRFIVDNSMAISSDLPTTVDFGNNLVNYIEVSADDAQIPGQGGEGDQYRRGGGGEPNKSPDKGKGIDRNDSHQEGGEHDRSKQPPRTKPVLGREHYTSAIPQYLLDLDKAEDSASYQYAAAAIQKLPTPPSLPGFLGKPILNAATPMKDDNSVLNMPNHTVLNHLATSSIKGNVLAVSATTRYKRKYVTTIMYKPTSDDTT